MIEQIALNYDVQVGILYLVHMPLSPLIFPTSDRDRHRLEENAGRLRILQLTLDSAHIPQYLN